MSLTASLQIGRSALTASQLALQVTGDNLANAATPGFHRRTAELSPAPGAIGVGGVNIGRGVNVGEVRRMVDTALQDRLRAGVSDEQGATVARDIFSQIEGLVSDLNGGGLSSQLSEFFDGFSELANNPEASETRALLVEQGESLGSFIQRLRTDLRDVRERIDSQLQTHVQRADELVGRIASINASLSNSEQGRVEDSALRDQRDQLLRELSELMDVSVNRKPNGMVDVFVGSRPLVLGTEGRGVGFRRETVDGELQASVVVEGAQEEKIEPQSGAIGGLLEQRDGAVNQTISDLDSLASSLIFEVNRLHSAGTPAEGLTEAVAEREVPTPDQTLALNDPDNETFTDLPFSPSNGSFKVRVTDQATGQTTTETIEVDLDGIDSTGAPDFSDDTSLADLQSALDGVANLNASIDAAGRLKITADSGFEFGFADDTSGVLATLGINTYFSGTDASDIGVAQSLRDNPQRLVAGVEPGENGAALAIAQLRDTPVQTLDGVSIPEAWRRASERISVGASEANTRLEAQSQVRESLESQQQAVSGVSIDEETLNLMDQQRQFQAAAQFITTIDELTNTLISLV